MISLLLWKLNPSLLIWLRKAHRRSRETDHLCYFFWFICLPACIISKLKFSFLKLWSRFPFVKVSWQILDHVMWIPLDKIWRPLSAWVQCALGAVACYGCYRSSQCNCQWIVGVFISFILDGNRYPMLFQGVFFTALGIGISPGASSAE